MKKVFGSFALLAMGAVVLTGSAEAGKRSHGSCGSYGSVQCEPVSSSCGAQASCGSQGTHVSYTSCGSAGDSHASAGSAGTDASCGSYGSRKARRAARKAAASHGSYGSYGSHGAQADCGSNGTVSHSSCGSAGH